MHIREAKSYFLTLTSYLKNRVPIKSPINRTPLEAHFIPEVKKSRGVGPLRPTETRTAQSPILSKLENKPR
jgi:hypothetical protein